ncbi:pectinesterase inhibitor 28-like [Papaver somniferum]|uniref:pectinesterase inhibitor 28-like n=1 Tax=Papaver somniferum TaxID=3469 RepID=UPI000E6FD8C0|nr:pectinesterase inhibitor 28-like [Papaver somniferum]
MASSVVYLISILSLIFIVQESSVLGDAGLIQSTCQKTRLPDLCTSTLNADPSSQEANMLGLANITVNVAETRAADISKYILDELVKSYTNANAIKVVTGCSDIYGYAKGALQASVEDLGYDLGDALLGLDIAAKRTEDCTDSFRSATPPLAYPDGLAQRQRDFQNLCGVATDTVQVIRTSNP